MGFYTVSRDLYSSKAASDITSETYWVGDADEIDLFLRGSPSTTTIQANTQDGRATDISNTVTGWSTLTTVTAHSGLTELIDIDPYVGYIRCQRSETTEVRLSLDQRTR